MQDKPNVPNELEGAVRRFALHWRRAAREAEPAIAEIEAMSAPAFRVLVAERLRAVERDVAEVRMRINGLLFVVAGAVVTQLVLRLVA
jgi:hypothetical protein